MNRVKTISIVLLVILLLNLVAVALGWIPIIAFWLIIGVGALFAYWILPRMQDVQQ